MNIFIYAEFELVVYLYENKKMTRSLIEEKN